MIYPLTDDVIGGDQTTILVGGRTLQNQTRPTTTDTHNTIQVDTYRITIGINS